MKPSTKTQQKSTPSKSTKFQHFEEERNQTNMNGINVAQLKQWKAQRQSITMQTENAIQLFALRKMKATVISNSKVIKIQSWCRMLKCRREFLMWKEKQNRYRKSFIRAWYNFMRSEKMFRRNICFRPFREWALEASESRRLKNVALTIFKKAVNNSKLTPQAVMAYFNPGGWKGMITELELNQVRRLILQAMFRGWLAEAKFIKIRHFKGSQVLKRTMRRTYSNLSPREMQLVAINLWHRYVVFKSCSKKGMVMPVFNSPQIPEWPKILQKLTMKKIQKMKVAERASLLVQTRAFKSWMGAIEGDAVMDDSNKQFIAESHFVERLGYQTLMAWRNLTRERGASLRRRERCFRAWAMWAPNHRRLKAAKRLMRNWSNSKNVDGHFRIWKANIQDAMGRRAHALKVLRQNMFQPKVLYICYTLLGREGNLMMLDCWARWKRYWTARCRWRTTQWHYRKLWYHSKCGAIFRAWKDAAKSGVLRSSEPKVQPNFSSSSGIEMFKSESSDGGLLNAVGGSVFWVPQDPITLQYSNERIEQIVLNLLDNGARGNLAHKPNELELNLFCRSHWQQSTEENIKLIPDREFTEEGQGLLEHADSSLTAERAAGVAAPGAVGSLQPGTAVVVADRVDALIESVISMSVKEMARLIVDGHRVHPQHVETLATFLGDKFIPIVALLLSACLPFVAKRILKGDLDDMIVKCNNPITAILIGTHVDRWSKLDITRREISTLTTHCGLETLVGTPYQSVVMWRAIVVQVMKQRCLQEQVACMTPEHALSEEEEVALIIRRQKLSKAWKAEEAIRTYFGISPESLPSRTALLESYKNYYIPKPKGIVIRIEGKPRAKDSWILNQDLGSIIREYKLLTGSLADSARQMREPLMKRDDLLLRRGLEKQARRDFLLLREMAESNMTDKAKSTSTTVKEERSHTKKSPEKKKVLGSSLSQIISSFGADDKNPLEEPSAELLDVDGNRGAPEVTADFTVVNGINGAGKYSFDDEKSNFPVVDVEQKECSYELQANAAIETWWPAILQHPSLDATTVTVNGKLTTEAIQMRVFIDGTNASIMTRLVASALHSVGRLIVCIRKIGFPSLLDQHYSNYNTTSNDITIDGRVITVRSIKSNINLGANLIEMVHARPNRMFLLRDWAWMPRRYWHPIRLSAAIEEEAAQVQKIISMEKERCSSIQEAMRLEEEEVLAFNDFLKIARKQIVKIGGKAKQETDFSNSMRLAVMRLIAKETKTTKALKEKLESLKQLVKMCRAKVDEGRFEEVFKLLEISTSVGSADGSNNADKLKSPAIESVDMKEAEIGGILEAIQVSEAAGKRHEANLRALDKQTLATKTLLSRLSNSKITSILEIQEMTQKLNSKYNALKANESSKKKKVKVLSKYVEGLLLYAQHINIERVDKIDENSMSSSISKGSSRKSKVVSKYMSFEAPKAKPIPRTSVVSLRRGSSFDINIALKGIQKGGNAETADALGLSVAPAIGNLVNATDDEFNEQAERMAVELLVDQSMGIAPDNRAELASQMSASELQSVLSFGTNDDDDIFDGELSKPISTPGAPAPRSPSRQSLLEYTRSSSALDQYSLSRKYSVYDAVEQQKEESEDEDIVVDQDKVKFMTMEVNSRYWSALDEMVDKPAAKPKIVDTTMAPTISSSLKSKRMPSVIEAEVDAISIASNSTMSDSKIFEDAQGMTQGRTKRMYLAVVRDVKVGALLQKRKTGKRVTTFDSDQEEDDDVSERTDSRVKFGDFKGEKNRLQSDSIWQSVMASNVASVSMDPAEHPDRQGVNSNSASHSPDGRKDNRRKAVAKIIVTDPFVTIGVKHVERNMHISQREQSILENAGTNDNLFSPYFDVTNAKAPTASAHDLVESKKLDTAIPPQAISHLDIAEGAALPQTIDEAGSTSERSDSSSSDSEHDESDQHADLGESDQRRFLTSSDERSVFENSKATAPEMQYRQSDITASTCQSPPLSAQVSNSANSYNSYDQNMHNMPIQIYESDEVHSILTPPSTTKSSNKPGMHSSDLGADNNSGNGSHVFARDLSSSKVTFALDAKVSLSQQRREEGTISFEFSKQDSTASDWGAGEEYTSRELGRLETFNEDGFVISGSYGEDDIDEESGDRKALPLLGVTMNKSPPESPLHIDTSEVHNIDGKASFVNGQWVLYPSQRSILSPNKGSDSTRLSTKLSRFDTKASVLNVVGKNLIDTSLQSTENIQDVKSEVDIWKGGATISNLESRGQPTSLLVLVQNGIVALHQNSESTTSVGVDDSDMNDDDSGVFDTKASEASSLEKSPVEDLKIELIVRNFNSAFAEATSTTLQNIIGEKVRIVTSAEMLSSLRHTRGKRRAYDKAYREENCVRSEPADLNLLQNHTVNIPSAQTVAAKSSSKQVSSVPNIQTRQSKNILMFSESAPQLSNMPESFLKVSGSGSVSKSKPKERRKPDGDFKVLPSPSFTARTRPIENVRLAVDTSNEMTMNSLAKTLIAKRAPSDAAADHLAKLKVPVSYGSLLSSRAASMHAVEDDEDGNIILDAYAAALGVGAPNIGDGGMYQGFGDFIEHIEKIRMKTPISKNGRVEDDFEYSELAATSALLDAPEPPTGDANMIMTAIDALNAITGDLGDRIKPAPLAPRNLDDDEEEMERELRDMLRRDASARKKNSTDANARASLGKVESQKVILSKSLGALSRGALHVISDNTPLQTQSGNTFVVSNQKPSSDKTIFPPLMMKKQSVSKRMMRGKRGMMKGDELSCYSDNLSCGSER